MPVNVNDPGSRTTASFDEIDYLSASDIERFGYCPLNWWLKFRGSKEKGKELAEGVTEHKVIAKDISTITEKEMSATRSQLGILWFAIIAVLMGINGVAIVYFKYITEIEPETFSFVLLIISILWLAIAVALFLFTLVKDILITTRETKDSGGMDKELTEKAPVVLEKPEQTEAAISISKWNWKNVALLFITVAIALGLNGYMLEYPFAPSEVLSRLLLTSALLWLMGTSIVLFFMLTFERRMKRIDKEAMEDKYLELHQTYSRSEYLMLWFASGAIILGITGFVVQYREELEPLDLFGRIFLVLSLLWMSVGFLFFYRSFWGGVKTQKISSEILSILDVDAKKPVNLKEHFDAIERGKVLGEEYSVLTMAVLAVILGINSILIRVEASDIFSRILEIVALIWLIGASFFLYDVLKHLQVTDKLRKLYSLGKASIEYSDDMSKDPKLLQSTKLGIRGRPDYILEEAGEMIPVEAKTGRVPRGPHFSHILQIAAYLALVEETYNKRPSHGFIRYGKDKEFRIEYDERLEQTLKEKINEMRKCIKKGDAHRNHHRPNKCRYCSRREGCPERLS